MAKTGVAPKLLTQLGVRLIRNTSQVVFGKDGPVVSSTKGQTAVSLRPSSRQPTLEIRKNLHLAALLFPNDVLFHSHSTLWRAVFEEVQARLQRGDVAWLDSSDFSRP